MGSESSKQTFILERNSSKNSVMGKMIYEPDVNGISNKNRQSENSPVRERSNNFSLDENDDSWNTATFCKSNDVRCFRDTTRKLKQGFKNLVRSPINQFDKSSSSRIREQYDCEVYQRGIYEMENHNSVNMEIQASAAKESKEILTLPRIVPMQRTVATPLSPIPSKTEAIKDELKPPLGSSTELGHSCSSKSVEVKLPYDPHLKITSSSIDVRKNKNGPKRNKRSRSEEEMYKNKKTKPDSIYSLLHNVNGNPSVNLVCSEVNRPICRNKRICQNCKHLFDDFEILRRSVSNNTYFREDFQFNINREEKSKHFIEMSRHCHIHGSNRVNNDLCTNRIHQLSENRDFLSHIDTSNNVTIADADRNHADYIDTFVNEERCQRNSNNQLSKSNIGCRDVEVGVNKNNKVLAMTQEEIRNLIDLDILAFTEKFRINITTESLRNINKELFNLLSKNLNNTFYLNKKDIMAKVKNVLRNKGLSDIQSNYLSNILTEHWEEQFLTINSSRLNSSNFQSNMLTVLQNITQDSSQYKHDENNITDIDNIEISIKGISRNDVDTNLKVYLSQISNEINEWITELYIPETQSKEIRQAIINDLATDIVDRHKYLELNTSSEISETSELEHLKYQIFKLIYKLGIGDLTLVDHAIDLMKRIQSIPVPIFSKPDIQEKSFGVEKRSSPRDELQQSFSQLNDLEPSNFGASSSRYLRSGNECCKRSTCKRNLSKKGMSESSSGKNISLREPERGCQATTSTRRMSSPGESAAINTEYNKILESHQSDANGLFERHQNSAHHIPSNRSTYFSGGIKIRDDEIDNDKNHAHAQIKPPDINEINNSYNQFVKEWVEKIPLPMSSVEDQKIAEIAKTDFYNGILEAVSKLRCEQDTFNNRFLFEDKLDDEIEKLMSELPQTPELSSKKHIFKVKLIEKTTNTNDLMKSFTTSYKQQLVDNLKGKLPKLSVSDNPDLLKIYEELQILNLVEDFIICSAYENQDPVVAEGYRKKLVKQTEDFVKELKANHNKALKNIDTKVYLEDILDALKNVPLPSNETLKNEADEILLSIEIDKWFSDLPLIENNDFVEQLHRRRLKNNLAKQILDLEKGNVDSIFSNSLKHEISQFLCKAPLEQGKSLNINSMVDELIKRLKNRPLNGNDTKKVAFNERDYEEFSRDIPLCSTYTEHPGKNIKSQNKSVLNTKSIQAIDLSQQLHNGHYHNISKPLMDDLKVDGTCCNTDHGILHRIPNYENFDATRPRSSSLKDEVEFNWHTLRESRQEYRPSNTSLNNITNQNTIEQNNKSIQAISPIKQSHKRHYHNIAQPLLDDLRLDSNCCNDELADDSTFKGSHPRSSMLHSGLEPNWYTLQESQRDYSQLNRLQSPDKTLRFVANPDNTSHRKDQDRFNQANEYNMTQEEFLVPQRYVENVDSNDFDIQQRNDISYENLRNLPKRMNDINTSISNRIREDDSRKSNNNIALQKSSDSHSVVRISPRRRESSRIDQRGSRLEQVGSPHRTSYYPTSPKEPNRHISNRSPRFQNVIEEERRGSPKLNQSDLFYRSTDPNGIRKTVERNKSIESNIDKGYPPDHISGYYQPSVLIPPGFVPLRIATKKGGYMTDRNIDERYQEEESEEENDEEDEVRCRCVEKMWKSKRRYRYCPFEQSDGFPMCLTSPYFYPYFY